MTTIISAIEESLFVGGTGVMNIMLVSGQTSRRLFWKLRLLGLYLGTVFDWIHDPDLLGGVIGLGIAAGMTM